MTDYVSVSKENADWVLNDIQNFGRRFNVKYVRAADKSTGNVYLIGNGGYYNIKDPEISGAIKPMINENVVEIDKLMEPLVSSGLNSKEIEEIEKRWNG
jgi:hypothetical protein